MPGKYSHSNVLANYSSRGIISLPNDQQVGYFTITEKTPVQKPKTKVVWPTSRSVTPPTPQSPNLRVTESIPKHHDVRSSSAMQMRPENARNLNFNSLNSRKHRLFIDWDKENETQVSTVGASHQAVPLGRASAPDQNNLNRQLRSAPSTTGSASQHVDPFPSGIEPVSDLSLLPKSKSHGPVPDLYTPRPRPGIRYKARNEFDLNNRGRYRVMPPSARENNSDKDISLAEFLQSRSAAKILTPPASPPTPPRLRPEIKLETIQTRQQPKASAHISRETHADKLLQSSSSNGHIKTPPKLPDDAKPKQAASGSGDNPAQNANVYQPFVSKTKEWPLKSTIPPLKFGDYKIRRNKAPAEIFKTGTAEKGNITKAHTLNSGKPNKRHGIIGNVYQLPEIEPHARFTAEMFERSFHYLEDDENAPKPKITFSTSTFGQVSSGRDVADDDDRMSDTSDTYPPDIGRFKFEDEIEDPFPLPGKGSNRSSKIERKAESANRIKPGANTKIKLFSKLRKRSQSTA